MKNVIFLTCWALFAHILPLAAQFQTSPAQYFNNPNFPEILQDTLVIRLQDTNQIHLTGATLTELATYERADSLKQFFFADLEKAFDQQVFSELPQRLHYLVNADGKRRLKADFSDPSAEKFDLEHEKKRLYLDLPQTHYTVYDLKTNVQLHFYLQDSTSIALIKEAQIKPALQEMAQDEKKLKKFVKYTVEKQGDVLKANPTRGSTVDMLEVGPLLGVSLIGNQLSPTLGAYVNLILQNRYSIPRYKFGMQYYGFILPSESGYNFREVNPGSMFDLICGVNAASHDKKVQWVGVSVGLTDKTRNDILPKHAFKSGFFVERGAFIYSAEGIKTSSKFYEKDQSKFLYMFSIKTTF